MPTESEPLQSGVDPLLFEADREPELRSALAFQIKRYLNADDALHSYIPEIDNLKPHIREVVSQQTPLSDAFDGASSPETNIIFDDFAQSSLDKREARQALIGFVGGYQAHMADGLTAAGWKDKDEVLSISWLETWRKLRAVLSDADPDGKFDQIDFYDKFVMHNFHDASLDNLSEIEAYHDTAGSTFKDVFIRPSRETPTTSAS